jgi:hypothetical protein
VNTAITSNAAAAFTNATSYTTTFASNASNISTGTLANGRLPSDISVSTVSAANLTTTTNTATFGTAAYFVANGNVGISNATPDARLTVTGTANVSGNVVVGGSLNAANVTATVFTGPLTGTASNATNLNSQPGSFYTNATNITTGTLPWAQAPSGTVNATGAFTISGLYTHTANIHTGNSTVNTQQSNAIIVINNSNTATLNASSIGFGNATVNSVYGLATLAINGATIANSTGANNAFNLGGAAAASYVNTSGAFTISGIHTYTANIVVGNTTVNTQQSNATILISNSTSTTTLGLTDLRIGNTTTNVIISNTVSSFGANVNVLNTINTASLTVGTTALTANTSQFLTSANVVLNANTTANNWLDVRAYVENETSPTISAATLTLNLANSMIFDVSLNASITTLTLSNVPSTASKAISFVLILTADGTARTVAWPAGFRWSGGNTAPTITSTLNKRDIFTFLSTDNGTTWNAFVTGQNI